MVGRAKLFRTTGSPLISGRLRRKGVPWKAVLAVVAGLAVVVTALWYFLLR